MDVPLTQLLIIRDQVDSEIRKRGGAQSEKDAACRQNRRTVCCDSCGSTHYRKDGLDHGKQRYRCLSCGHRFTAVSGTELDNSKISYETVFSLVELIVYDLPLWVIAKIAGVNQKTARLWRFRVADAAVEYNDGIILEGKVWLDETYWRQTDKSMTFVGRGGLRLRGLSRNLVCVVIAYDCHGNYYASVLGKPGNPGSSEITSALKRHIARGSLVIP